MECMLKYWIAVFVRQDGPAEGRDCRGFFIVLMRCMLFDPYYIT